MNNRLTNSDIAKLEENYYIQERRVGLTENISYEIDVNGELRQTYFDDVCYDDCTSEFQIMKGNILVKAVKTQEELPSAIKEVLLTDEISKQIEENK